MEVIQIKHFSRIASQNKFTISPSRTRKVKCVQFARKYTMIVLIQNEHCELEPMSSKRLEEFEHFKQTEYSRSALGQRQYSNL